MEKLKGWLFLLIALLWIPAVGGAGGYINATASIWVQVIALAIIGATEVKAAK